VGSIESWVLTPVRADEARDRISGVACRINQAANCRDAVCRHAELACVFTNHFLVRSEVNAVESVVGDVAMQPLDLRSDPAEDVERFDRNVPDLVLGHAADAGNLAFNDELGHGIAAKDSMGCC
jgi:hypothetical protein